jgi:hypothetical protein
MANKSWLSVGAVERVWLAMSSSSSSSPRRLRPPRAVRAIQLQAALAEALRAARDGHAATHVLQANPPAGMKFLITPHEALTLRQPQGDATALRIAFARFVFWRTLLGQKRPTKDSMARCVWRLRALALWHYAVRAHAAGTPLPLKAAKHPRDVPAYAVSPVHLPGANGRKPRGRQGVMTPASDAQRASDNGGNTSSGDPGRTDESYDFGDYLTDYLDIAPDDPLAAVDNAPWDSGVLDAEGYDALDFWEQWGDLPEMPAGDMIDPAAWGMTQADFTAAGEVLTFGPLLDMLASAGLSDLQIARMIDAGWAGQTAQWAGQQLYDEAGGAAGGSSGAGGSSSAGGEGAGGTLFGTFSIRDPYFYDYLRQQAGYLISPAGVGAIDALRGDIAETMWDLLGGAGGPGLSVTAIARYLASDYGPDLEEGTKFSADWRAYMIAVTETARAESFGEFVAMWTLGAKQKMWIANAGACEICETNVDAGPLPLTADFPGGFKGPPQHPICRCATAPVVPDAFNPNDWQTRSPSALDPLLFTWTGTRWPDVDLSALDGLDGLDGLDTTTAADVEMAAAAEAMRADTRHRPIPTAAVLLPAYDAWVRLADVAQHAALQWAHAAHVRLPDSERELLALVRHLDAAEPGHDAHARDDHAATEHYLVTLRRELRVVLHDVARMARTQAHASAHAHPHAHPHAHGEKADR